MLLSHSKLCCKNNGKIFGTVWSTVSKLSYELQQARTPVLYICHPQHTWVLLQAEENTFDGYFTIFFISMICWGLHYNLATPLTITSPVLWPQLLSRTSSYLQNKYYVRNPLPSSIATMWLVLAPMDPSSYGLTLEKYFHKVSPQWCLSIPNHSWSFHSS